MSEYVVLEGTPGDDITSALESAFAQGLAQGKAVFLAFKGGIVSRPVEVKTDLLGGGPNVSGIISSISTGEPTLYVQSKQYLTLSGISIEGQNDGQNTTGIKLGEYDSVVAGTSVSRSSLRDMLIRKCALGLEWNGWINAMGHVIIRDCILGAKLFQQNASCLELLFEQCERAFYLKDSKAINIPRLLIEGNSSTCKHPGVFEDVISANVGSVYIEIDGEEAPVEPMLLIGEGLYSFNIALHAVSAVPRERSLIHIDRGNGVVIDSASDGIKEHPWSVSNSANNVDIKHFRT